MIAIVTGAGTGIGRAVTAALIKEGFSVVLAGRRADSLMAARQAADPGGEHSRVVATDVADPASVDQLFAATQHEFGRLDVLFNNAGISAPGTPLEDLTVEQWRAVVDTNLTGTFLCTRA